MSSTLLILIGSTITLVVMTGVFRVEDARGGQKIILVSLRHLFDKLVLYVYQKISSWHPYVGQGFLRLMFHYIAHSILRRLLALLRKSELLLEQVLRRNRQVAKKIDSEKKQTHLDAIAAHRKETALTERQKQKLRSHD